MPFKKSLKNQIQNNKMKMKVNNNNKMVNNKMKKKILMRKVTIKQL